MENSQFSLLVEKFIAGVRPRLRRESIRITKSFTAAEALLLPGDTIFDHDINMEGHILRIAGNATFCGSVDSAIVLALGKVDIEGESRNSHIFALDSLHVAQADSSTLLSCGDMEFDTDVMRTSAAAAGTITGGNASVYGGMIVAGSSINLRNACTLPDDPPASLKCGNRAMATSAAQLETAYINRLVRLRKYARGHLLSDDIEGDLAFLQNEIEKYRAASELLRLQAAKPQEYTIAIPGRADHGTQIDINGRSFTVDNDLSGVVFGVQDRDIIIDHARQNVEFDETMFMEL